jgi:hypothetical protein
LGGQRAKAFDLPVRPCLVAAEFRSQNVRDFRSHFYRCPGVQKEGAGSPGKDVLCGASHLFASGPDDFGSDVGQFGMQLPGQPGLGSRQGLNLFGVRSINSQGAEYLRVLMISVQVQIEGEARRLF